MLRGRDYLSALTYLNGEFNQTPSVFHDKNVIAEYNDFQFVQVNEGLYCNGIQLHPSKIVDQMDQIRGSVIRSNGNELRQWRTVDQFIFQLNEFFRGKKCYTVKEVKGKIFIGTNTGWYVYDSGDKIIPIVTGENLNAIAFGLNDYEIKKFSGETLAKYIISLNNALSSSYDPISGYTRMLDFGLSANIITDIAVGNQYTYLIGTDNGLFYTTYKYALTNDIRSMTLAEVDAEVLEGYNSQISVHVAGYHEIPNSTVTYINENVMPADFSELSGWTHRDESSSDFTVIEQDLVEKILFEDVIKHVTVTYANVMTNGVETELDGITYIYKKWISGINELYVNVPSTNTYYFNHISGVTACKYSEEEIVRPNTQLTAYSDIEKMSTTLRIKVERKTFDNVQNFFGCYITGNSLPMKIYKDDTYICDGAEKYFHSYIQPSTYIGQSVNDQCVILEFKCFGTDSQSIRLMGCVGSDQPDRIINETGGYITGSADTRIRIARWPEI